MDTLWFPTENEHFMESIFLFIEPAELQVYDYFSLCLQIFNRKKNPPKSVWLLFKKNCTMLLRYILLRVILLQ